MADDIRAIVANIVTAIDTERTDVICSALNELKNPENGDALQKVLNELHTECGTILHYATKHGKVDKVRAILAGGADPGIQNKDGQLPLDLASDKIRTVYNEEFLKATALSNLGRVCQLLAGGVSIHLTDSPEMVNTPLHWAACHGNRDIVQCLCARGANVNAVNARGLIPLHEAVKRGDAGIVEELLNYGADKEIPVSMGEDVGQTSVDLAQGKESILQAFRAPRELLDPLNSMKHEYDGIIANGLNGRLEKPGSPTVASPVHKAELKLDTDSSSFNSSLADDKLSLLWPAPQKLRLSGAKPFEVKEALIVFVAPGREGGSGSEIASLWNSKRHIFHSLDLELSLNLLTPMSSFDSPHVVCHVNNRLVCRPESYRLSVTPKQIKLVCADIRGLSYAISTLLQLLFMYSETSEANENCYVMTVPSLLIEDYPSLPYRGVLLDVSQGRIPQMDYLEDYLDTLSVLKFNQVYLYTRFHSNLPPQWQCPYSRSEVLHLTEFCLKHHMQFIPVIEVGPRVQFEDLPKLYAVFQDFLACCGGSEFVSAGPRLSSFLLDATEDNLGVSDVVRYLPILSHQILQLCGYPLHDLGTPLLQQLPPGIAFKEYAVKADHDYSKFCKPLVEHGINYFVCPGTAAWNSLAGCPKAAVCNIVSAANENEGAIGMVVCDWTGKGHLNHHAFSWPGILTAAGLSWNKAIRKDVLESCLPSLLNQHVFKDETGMIGGVVMELGHAETFAIRRVRNQAGDDLSDLPEEYGSILYRFLTHPDGVPLESLSTESLQQVTRHVKKCQEALGKSRLQHVFGETLKAELELTMELMLLACRIGKSLVLAGRKPNKQAGHEVVNFGISNLSPTTRTDLANRLLELTRQFKDIWKMRSNPKVGLHDSLQRLQSLLKVLLPESEHSSLLIDCADTDGMGSIVHL